MVPDSGGTYNLPRLIGKQRAAGLMFSGEKISSAEAEKIGMIYKSVDDENGYQVTLDFAKKISEKPTKSIGLIKSLLNKSDKNSISEQLELEKKYQKFLMILRIIMKRSKTLVFIFQIILGKVIFQN